MIVFLHFYSSLYNSNRIFSYTLTILSEKCCCLIFQLKSLIIYIFYFSTLFKVLSFQCSVSQTFLIRGPWMMTSFLHADHKITWHTFFGQFCSTISYFYRKKISTDQLNVRGLVFNWETLFQCIAFSAYLNKMISISTKLFNSIQMEKIKLKINFKGQWVQSYFSQSIWNEL